MLTTSFGHSIRRNQYCINLRSHLGSAVSFVLNQLQKYNIRDFTSYFHRPARVFPLLAIRVLLLLDCTEARHNWSDSTGLLHRVWSRWVCVPTYIRPGLHLGVMGANRYPSPHIDRLSHTGLRSAVCFSTGFILFPNLFSLQLSEQNKSYQVNCTQLLAPFSGIFKQSTRDMDTGH